jgi:NAD(P)-dependent dehydrogenase (short-subunit alcohol dehydrogenase family)
VSSPRVVLVTGASSGIGRATALAAARRGDHVVLVARGRRSLDEAASECRAASAASTLPLAADVGVDAEVADVVTRTLQQHSRIDAVVNSAGVVAYGRVEDVPADVFDGVLRTNLVGSVNLARHVVPVLRRQESGTLLLVGSVIGHVAIPTMSAYVLSKWGVRALARQLSVENRDLPGVRIRYVAPGGVDTPIYDQAANYAGFAGRPPPPAASAHRIAAQVLRRVDGRRLPEQLSVFNFPMMLGFQRLPRLYDALVGTVFPLGATDLTKPVEPGPGNVLAPVEDGNELDGRHGSGLVGLLKNVRARAAAGERPAATRHRARD